MASTSGSRKRKATVVSTFIKASVRDCIATSKIMPQLPTCTEYEDTESEQGETQRSPAAMQAHDALPATEDKWTIV